MANMWDPIDPEDIVDLWVDFGGTTNPFLPVGETISSHTITVPTEIHTVTSSVDSGGQMIRWRTGPNSTVGKYPINFHITTSATEQYDVDVMLTVKERIKK